MKLQHWLLSVTAGILFTCIVCIALIMSALEEPEGLTDIVTVETSKPMDVLGLSRSGAGIPFTNTGDHHTLTNEWLSGIKINWPTEKIPTPVSVSINNKEHVFSPVELQNMSNSADGVSSAVLNHAELSLANSPLPIFQHIINWPSAKVFFGAS